MVDPETPLQVLSQEARRLSGLIDKGVIALHEAAQSVAHAEHAYRQAKAKAWLEAEGDLAREREAAVDALTADLRLARDLSEGARQAAIEALRSRRQQLSALQSILHATRSEMEMAR